MKIERLLGNPLWPLTTAKTSPRCTGGREKYARCSASLLRGYCRISASEFKVKSRIWRRNSLGKDIQWPLAIFWLSDIIVQKEIAKQDFDLSRGKESAWAGMPAMS